MQVPEHDDILRQLEAEARRKMASQGGKARQATMSVAERQALATKAIQARWARNVEERAQRKVQQAKFLAELRAEKRAQKRKPKNA